VLSFENFKKRHFIARKRRGGEKRGRKGVVGGGCMTGENLVQPDKFAGRFIKAELLDA